MADRVEEVFVNTAEKRDGTAGLGGGLAEAQRDYNQQLGDAFQKPPKDAKGASYAAELGAQLAAHAQDPHEVKGGDPNPGTKPDKRLKENQR